LDAFVFGHANNRRLNLNTDNHIEQHSLRLRTLEQIASECHVNNAYLCRLFRRYDDQSPYQYLLRLKMNFAAERLQRPGVMVKQVAGEVGFTNLCRLLAPAWCT
jgi:AraC-like DNA-binding protein